jgi:hypothetical protein
MPRTLIHKNNTTKQQPSTTNIPKDTTDIYRKSDIYQMKYKGCQMKYIVATSEPDTKNKRRQS